MASTSPIETNHCHDEQSVREMPSIDAGLEFVVLLNSVPKKWDWLRNQSEFFLIQGYGEVPAPLFQHAVMLKVSIILTGQGLAKRPVNA